MPYIKAPEAPYAPLRRLLLGYEIDPVGLARILGCSRPTAASRLKDPSALTVGELRAISQRGHIPADEIRAAIRL